eukprot:scaffold5380_cov131-Cylindrotheca_fusiformis.AAC.18
MSMLTVFGLHLSSVRTVHIEIVLCPLYVPKNTYVAVGEKPKPNAMMSDPRISTQIVSFTGQFARGYLLQHSVVQQLFVAIISISVQHATSLWVTSNSRHPGFTEHWRNQRFDCRSLLR